MRVTVISTSPRKQKEAVQLFGADRFVISGDDEEMKVRGIRSNGFRDVFRNLEFFWVLLQEVKGSMDGIIDTVPAPHQLGPLIDLLKVQGKLVVVGGSPDPLMVPPIPLLMGRYFHYCIFSLLIMRMKLKFGV